MGPSERRRAILEHLCQKRFDTTKNLAELFGVCERTIRNDLVVLTCSYPIEEDVFQNANLSREKVTEAVCPSLK